MSDPAGQDGHNWKLADPLRQPVIISHSIGESLPQPLHLSGQEITRGEAIQHAGAKRSYLLQHHLLRSFLSHWLGAPPNELGFVTNPHGKPALENSALHFSISRSGPHLAFYFGPQTGGIDIETLRASGQFQGIIDSHFHPNEQRSAQDEAGFFRVWTRKEAVLKATGTGLIDELAALDCSPDHVDHSGQSFSLKTLVTSAHVISLALSGSGAASPLCFRL